MNQPKPPTPEALAWIKAVLAEHFNGIFDDMACQEGVVDKSLDECALALNAYAAERERETWAQAAEDLDTWAKQGQSLDFALETFRARSAAPAGT